MVAWYKHDIPAWMDGTESLDADSYRAYHVICQLIYLNEGPIALNEHGIAGRCKMHILKFRKCVDHLVGLGKLILNPGATSGQPRGNLGATLDQPRANLELRKIGSNRVNAGLGGSSPRKLLKNNDAGEATLQEDQSDGVYRLEKTREEKKESCPVAKPTRTKEIYSEEFEANFWKPFPRTSIMSKKEAWREWAKLDADQRAAACKAIEPYRRHLKQNPTLHAVHACRFLSQNRAEGILEIASEKPAFDIRSHLV